MSGNKKGFFAVGVEGVSKAHNAGAIFRTAHAFGADFVFSINPHLDVRGMYETDTSRTFDQVPYYQYDTPKDLSIPSNCAIVGVELTDDSVELPEFRHPNRAVYVLGPERGNLSPEMQEKCDYIIKIPTSFCLNVSVAAAIVVYDRISSVHTWRRRPLTPRGNPESLPKHQSGGAIIRSKGDIKYKYKGYDF